MILKINLYIIHVEIRNFIKDPTQSKIIQNSLINLIAKKMGFSKIY